MDKPSKRWKCLRRAALDRAQRAVSEPLESLYSIYGGVCLCYLAGFLQLQFFEPGSVSTLVTALLLTVVATCGAFVLLLTGSVLAMHFTSLKLKKLASE